VDCPAPVSEMIMWVFDEATAKSRNNSNATLFLKPHCEELCRPTWLAIYRRVLAFEMRSDAIAFSTLLVYMKCKISSFENRLRKSILHCRCQGVDVYHTHGFLCSYLESYNNIS
jgi:hypothetical protein